MKYSKRKLILLSALMMIITVSMSSAALSDPSIYHHQQNALAQINDTIFKTYENSIYGILMQYPFDWKNVDPGQFSQTNNFNIVVGFLSSKQSASYEMRSFFDS